MIEIVESRYTKDGHEKMIIDILNSYAKGLSGGGNELPENVKQSLVGELEKRKNIHTIIAFVDGKAAGLIIAIESFSTFACRPVLNLHDIIVLPEFRRKGIATLMIAKIEALAHQLGCCKLTLEVLEGNEGARALYETVGFHSYELDPKMGKALFWEKKLKECARNNFPILI